ncbi:NADP-dependent oxidoreductase [Sphingomonas sp. BK069]|uniref:NADP-dependent oxidoreductase n=1 Tax=Sphingomonas sp. BK069 TaxID=2586979 RepID=UPI001614EAE3|nr:NADP-dependent oxidoreductase [Sphingomonas sp. BK069]MBB3348333.1 NADPH:quinone reductase-like Zn-dependent oxidoreductase [Sphingomonas sp. BK069]
MKAFAIGSYGDALRLVDVPEPVARAGQVVVEVEAASLNPLDEKVRAGDLKMLARHRMPLVLGSDLAGKVVATGPGVSRFRVGDEVFGKVDLMRIGTLAERVAVSEMELAAKPRGLSMEGAASLPLVGLTAWQALVELADVQPGQKVLVHAGSGGVGTIAIQLARHLGASVATTASTFNLELMRSLGAAVAIDYRAEHFTRLRGYDLVLTSLDTDILERSLGVLRRGGRLISLSGPPDPTFARSIGAGWAARQIIRARSARIRRHARRLGIEYSFLFVRSDGEQLARIAELVENGAIRPVLDRVMPFERAPDALALLAQRRGPGKIVLSRSSQVAQAAGLSQISPVADLLGRLNAIEPVTRVPAAR